MKWIKKKFTMVIISDANKPVFRIRVPDLVLYLLLIFFTMLTLALYSNHTKLVNRENRLESQLIGKKEEIKQTVADKNQTIDSLQTEVVTLSRQFDQLKVKIEDLKKLESELMNLTGKPSKKSSGESAVMSLAASAGLGGEDFSLTDKEIARLEEQTKSTIYSLESSAAQLSANLASTRSLVLAKQHILNMTPSIWPAEPKVITSKFGPRIDPFTHRASFHSGVDIGAAFNDPVYSAAEGTVQFTGWDKDHGNNIIINHANGIITWYMHLNKINVRRGDYIMKSQLIGRVGSTGRSTGPHLHYEIHQNGVRVDPMMFLE